MRIFVEPYTHKKREERTWKILFSCRKLRVYTEFVLFVPYEMDLWMKNVLLFFLSLSLSSAEMLSMTRLPSVCFVEWWVPRWGQCVFYQTQDSCKEALSPQKLGRGRFTCFLISDSDEGEIVQGFEEESKASSRLNIRKQQNEWTWTSCVPPSMRLERFPFPGRKRRAT